MTRLVGHRIASLAIKVIIGLLLLLIPLRGAIAQLAPTERRAAAANTVLVSGVFAAGTGGTAITSSHYRMLGVLGEAALPVGQTTLTSQNYQLQPGFLAGLPAAPGHVYLPALLRNYINYFAGPNEAEPNNIAAQANGPLRSGVDYHGYQDDGKDYFSFFLLGAGNIMVDLTNTSGQGTQLLLYYQVADAPHRVSFAPTPPFHIGLASQPGGQYYIEVFTDGGFNTSTPYTLRVTYP